MSRGQRLTLIPILVIALSIAACSPSQQSIQTALANTQASWTSTPIPTLTPFPTLTPLPTPTRTQVQTTTPDLRNSYVLEAGACPVNDLPAGDPKLYGCIMSKQLPYSFLGNKNSNTLEIPQSLPAEYPYFYCALFAPDGSLLSVHLSEKGGTRVACYLNEPPTPTLNAAAATKTAQALLVAETKVALATQAAETKDALALLQSPKDDGFYLIGIDIAPGIWRSNGSGAKCYWSITTETGDIISNHFGMSGGTMFVPKNGFQVELQDCGMWTFIK